MDHIVQDGQQKISENKNFGCESKVKINYDKAIHCIRGPDVTIYDSSEYTNVSDAVRDAINNITDRQGAGRGVTILWYAGWFSNTSDIINIVTEVSDKPPLCYFTDELASIAGVKSATEEEMKMWLNDRGNTNLVTDINAAAGWEDGTVIVFDNGRSVDNMCLRSVSSLHVIKIFEYKV